jgi:hypothetical protein
MILPKRNENLPGRSEIATLAAVLLGAARSPSAGGGYSPAKARDIAAACRDALSLLQATDGVAKAIKEGGSIDAGFRWVAEFERARRAEDSLPGIMDKVKVAGWDGGPLGPNDRLPWEEFFHRFMLPGKTSKNRLELFNGWLKHHLECTPERLEDRRRELVAHGIGRELFIAHLSGFPGWRKRRTSEERSIAGSKGAKAKAEKAER